MLEPTIKDVDPTVAEPVPGIPVVIGNQRYLMPRLTAKLLKRHKDTLHKIATLTPEQEQDASAVVDMALPIITEALKRNYGDVKAEELEECIEVGEPFNELIRAMMGQAGYRPPKPGE